MSYLSTPYSKPNQTHYLILNADAFHGSYRIVTWVSISNGAIKDLFSPFTIIP